MCNTGKHSNVKIWYLRFFSDFGVTDPSWMELRNFLYFLNTQIADCEQSVFCKADLTETLPLFKKFVVKFMLIMAKVSQACHAAQENGSWVHPIKGSAKVKSPSY